MGPNIKHLNLKTTCHYKFGDQNNEIVKNLLVGSFG
jgi:hypothetical protein